MKMMTRNLLNFISIGIGIIQTISGYVLNNDPNYTRWPGGRIPFALSPEYSQQEIALITQAMQQLTAELGGCIQFQQIQFGTTGTNYVIISKSGGPGVPSPTCFSYPGMVASQGGLGQYMSIQGGQSGCLSDIKSVKRLLVDVLGLRPEHNKPTRDQFIQVNPGNVEARSQPYVPLATIDPSKVISSPDFDYNSITLINPLEFSGNGGPVLASRGPQLLNNGAISMKDCQALTSYYGCPSTTCRDPYGAGGYNIPGSSGFNNQFPINQFPINQFPSNQFPNNQFPNNPLFPNQIPPNSNFPTNNFPINNFPTNNFPNGNFPTNNFPANNFPNSNFPANNFPNSNFPNNNFPNNNFPTNTFPNSNFPNNPLLPNNNPILPNNNINPLG